MDAPRLIESSARRYLEYGIRRAREVRLNAYFYALNAAVLAAALVVAGGFAWAYYRPRMTDAERAEKLLRDQAIVLAKIRGYQAFAGARGDRAGAGTGAITGLAAAGDPGKFAL